MTSALVGRVPLVWMTALTLCTTAQHCTPQVIRSTMKRNISHIYSGLLLTPSLFLSLSFSLSLILWPREVEIPHSFLDCITQCLLPDLPPSLPPISMLVSLSLSFSPSRSLSLTPSISMLVNPHIRVGWGSSERHNECIKINSNGGFKQRGR